MLPARRRQLRAWSRHVYRLLIKRMTVCEVKYLTEIFYHGWTW